MSRRGFARSQNPHESALICNMKRQLLSMKQEIAELKAVNAMNRERLTNACSAMAELRAEFEVYKAATRPLFECLSGQFDFLERHVRNIGGHYPDENVPVYLQMAQCGESIWNLFVEHMGFPCWRTIQRWRSSFLERFELSRETLDGEIEHLNKLFSVYFGADYKAKGIRVVLAVDAAGVSPRVVVHKNGEIDGFVDDNAAISVEEAQILRGSLTSLRAFVAEHHSDIVKDFFVMFVCPLESICGGFPILLYPKVNGSADPRFVEKVLHVVNNVRQCSIDVLGLGCDGDLGYLRFVRDMTQAMQIVDLSKPLSHQNVPFMLVFEDLLHLAKCVRYRFVCGSEFCPLPHFDATVSVQDFQEIGIPAWILDPSQVRKMDDFMPVMMFNVENFLSALDSGKPIVALALLPVTLLISAVMTSELTRTQRLDYLSRAWALFWCYKQAYTCCVPSIPQHVQGKMKGQNKKMAIYDYNTLDKALSLCFALSRVIADSRQVHLGALGTHWLEHLFGNVRRLCQKNDCPANFERSILMIMLQKAIHQPNSLNTNRSRLSDSGVRLPAEQQSACLPSLPIGSFIFEAAMTLQINPQNLLPPASFMLIAAAQLPKRTVTPDLFLRSMVVDTRATPDCGSTRRSRMTDVGGLTTRSRDIMKGQI